MISLSFEEDECSGPKHGWIGFGVPINPSHVSMKRSGDRMHVVTTESYQSAFKGRRILIFLFASPLIISGLAIPFHSDGPSKLVGLSMSLFMIALFGFMTGRGRVSFDTDTCYRRSEILSFLRFSERKFEYRTLEFVIYKPPREPVVYSSGSFLALQLKINGRRTINVCTFMSASQQELEETLVRLNQAAAIPGEHQNIDFP
jgi:hypothetical protein